MSLHFNDVTLGYAGTIAIKGFSAKLDAGSLIAVIGDNGSGKSTLLKAIAGVIKPVSGKITKPKKSRVAYLAQQSDIDKTFPIDVETLVKMGLWPLCGLWKSQRPYQSKIQDALEKVRLVAQANYPLDTLSSGQLQRALFARIIVQDSNIILLDEPFNGVDLNTKKDLLLLIRRWQQQGRTIFIALHDPLIVKEHFSRVIHIDKRCAVYEKTAQFLDAGNHHFLPSFMPNFSWVNLQKQYLLANISGRIGS
ncbi:ABC transporter, ATP-binding protein [Bartonella australis AUST/NH1]|uniref:ABC transporter, ATP-binding protein n=1 Tax=Bartonella australis (strain Aust/NH1) TaxID=1094489 RepID=M1NS73_BARAA|nr:ABC transporter ATP-binding protein [Bartonella australis]AGF74198.1 ABC transporter, ATP-binding protein [Bartonella australis AUST/NH1]